MIDKPSAGNVADTHRNFYLWLRRAIPCNLLTVIDHPIYVRQNRLVWPGPLTHSQRSGTVKGLASRTTNSSGKCGVELEVLAYCSAQTVRSLTGWNI